MPATDPLDALISDILGRPDLPTQLRDWFGAIAAGERAEQRLPVPSNSTSLARRRPRRSSRPPATAASTDSLE